MLAPLSFLVLAAVSLTSTSPVVRRAVQELNQKAFAEAQQRDDTATRAFSNTAIKVGSFLQFAQVTSCILITSFSQTSDGQCLSVDLLSGDFRANLTPVQVTSCNSTAGQKWDIITSGKNNNQEGAMLVVSTLVSVLHSHVRDFIRSDILPDTSLSQLRSPTRRRKPGQPLFLWWTCRWWCVP
jgi:hypothetical protein